MVSRSLNKIPSPTRHNPPAQKARWKKRAAMLAPLVAAALVITLGKSRLGSHSQGIPQEPGGKRPVPGSAEGNPDKGERGRKVNALKSLLKTRKQLQEAKRRLSSDDSQDDFKLWKRDLMFKSLEELNMEWCHQTWRILHPQECAPGQSDCENREESAQDPWASREAVEEEMIKRWGEGERPEEKEKTNEQRNWAAALKERTDSEIEYFLDGELRLALRATDYYNLAIEVGNEDAEADALGYSEDSAWRLKALMREASGRNLIQ
ncbi:hypothetical protein JW721_03605 [Candidatus Micrarchaeota archaeon]|nr:hypothetical protein [Candidatus Micrarchaeota archaeon]